MPETLPETTARISFHLSPDDHEEFERCFRYKLVPILEKVGLRVSTKTGRQTVGSVFSKLLTADTPLDVLRFRETLTAGNRWQEVLREFALDYGNAAPDGLIRHTLALYEAPAGPGRELHGVNRKGTWHTFDVTDGLVSGFVWSILQSKSGKLWFTCYGGGVSCFDGRVFRNYTTRDGLAHNEVSCVFEDRDGMLWFGTEAGISRFDGESFQNLTTEDGLVHNEVSTIIEDTEGSLWIGTEGGVSCYDGEIFRNLTTEDGLANNQIAAILLDRNGHFWFGTEGGLSRYNGRIFSTFTTREGLGDNWVRSILEDREGHLWFGTNAGGVSKYDGQEFTNFADTDGLAGNGILCILQDKDGDLWFGTYGGVSRFDGTSFTTLTERDGLANNRVWSITQDREGHLWFGTFSGLNRYDGRTFTSFNTHEDTLVDNGVMSVLQDNDDNLWFAPFGGGITRFDGTSFTAFTTKDGLPDNVVLSSLKAQNGNLWFGTWDGGVVLYDGQTFKTFTEDDGLGSNRVWEMAEDHDGNIWFATWGGLTRFDGKSFRNFTEKDGLAHNRARCLAVDQKGHLWIGTFGGATRYDGTTWNTYGVADGLAADSVWSITADSKGNVWFGSTGDGVTRFDGKRCDIFTTADGLTSDNIWSSLEDREGNLWFGTSGGGLSRFDGNVFQTLTIKDGLSGNVCQVIFQDKEGSIWVGTNKGVTHYRPPGAFAPTVNIDAVVADRRYETTEEIELSESTRLVAFEFNGKSYKTRPEAMVYRYRLAGVDPDWRSTGNGRVEYQDLPVGNYTFEVQAVDRDLVYSETPATLQLSVSRDGRDEQISELEHRVQERTRELIQSEKMAALGILVAGIAHEINNPIGAINSATDVLNRGLDRITGILQKNGALDAQLEKLLNILKTSTLNALSAGDRISQIVKHLRNFARLDEAEYQKADLREGLDSTLALLPYESQTPVSIVKEYGDIPEIYCYPAELNQVFMNLLLNAIEAIEEHGVITIETSSDTQNIWIKISDTGRGIPQKTLDRIFDPGFTTTGVGVGTGLGLSISFNIVQKHRGTLSIESEMGKGSVVTIQIPLK
jgi:ligand-binding sensor domain-containing protein/nitrogen-specific signal transduction histidine kinase